MIIINNLSASPDTFTTGKAKPITLSWSASIDGDADNPVDIELSLNDDNPVFFLDINDKTVKNVFWSTSKFKTDTKIYKETLFIKVMPTESIGDTAIITMNASHNNSEPVSSDCTIIYK